MVRHARARTALVSLCLAFVVAGCSETTTIGSYQVTYHTQMAGVGTIDSIFYDNGTGTMVRVATPAVPHRVTVTAYPGSTVSAIVYGNGTAAGQAKIRVIWNPISGAITGDSATAATAAATKFTLTIAPKTL